MASTAAIRAGLSQATNLGSSQLCPRIALAGSPAAMAAPSVRIGSRTCAIRSEMSAPPPAPEGMTPPADQKPEEAGVPFKVRVNPSGAKTSVFDGGFAQETINGRAAMLGFLAALGAELATGDSVYQQLALKGGLPLLLVPASILAILIGSFAPRVFDVKENGLDMPAKAFGPFTPSAEILNGRAAMIGFVALLTTEAVKGSALF